ncbi:MAG: T9SS type A sorting domain-containing protein [Saprospiraceae bacterium]
MKTKASGHFQLTKVLQPILISYNLNVLSSHGLALDLNGNIIWDRKIAFHPNYYYITSGATSSEDGGFYIPGLARNIFSNKDNPFLIKIDANGNSLTNEIHGSVSVNLDSCAFDTSNYFRPNHIVKFEQGSNTSWFLSTDTSGWFAQRADSADYTLTTVPPNNYWEMCEDTLFGGFNGYFSNDTSHFVMQPTVSCPSMQVSISAPRMRRCDQNFIYVNYCNNGTAIAQNASIEVTLDPRLTFISAGRPYTLNGNVYTFLIDDVDLFECGDFTITTLLDCDSAALGETICLEAHAFPDSLCTPPDPLWNGADLRITGYCDGDSVRFTIKNEGAALPTSQDFIIIEDDMVMRLGNTPPLGSEETYDITVLAEGSTYRLQMNQVPGHPWSINPGLSVESCGQNGIGGTNTGFVTMYSPDDNADFLDVDCVEVRASYDPNDKEAFPKGVCASHFINDDTELEYKIRFQNEGNDTAYIVIIRDTLSEFLDPASVKPMVGSHPYTWSLSGKGILTFTFDNINLVDKGTNEPESHGFIQYRISQMPGNPVDTKIENKAAIYFDFNPPIITNTVEHLVGEDYLVQQGGNLSIAGKITRDDGLPLDSVKVYLSNNCVTYTNQNGDYLFPNLEAGLDYRIWAEKDEDHANGLTFLDILEYRNTILNFDTLQSVYRYFVADVNGSQTVTTFDLVLTSKVMAQEVQRFPNVDHCWLFFDATGPYPQTRMDVKGNQIEIKNLQADQMDNNFRAAKLGDLIYEDQLTQVDLNQTLSIGTPSQSCSNLISLPVVLKGDNLADVKSVSFLVDYDPAQLEIFGLGRGNTIFPDITTILHGNPGKKLVYFDNAGTFKNDVDSLIVGYIYFVPIAEENEPVEVSIDMNNLQAIVETVQHELSIFDVQNSNFLMPAYADLSLNVTAIDIPCDNIGATVCIKDFQGNDFAAYLWNTGETTSCIALNNSMTVQCWVTDNNGCQNLMSSPVNVVTPDPVAIASVQLTNASAANATDGSISNVVVVGGVGPYTFLWSTGATTTAIFNLAPELLQVTITDGNGCQLIQGYTISYPTSAEDIIANIATADIQPNPVKRNELSILEIQSLKGYEMELEIRDISGRLLSQKDISVRKGKTRVSLEPQKAAGLYLVSLTIEGKAVKTLKWSVL